MERLYKLVGWVSLASESLSHVRLHLFPMNFLVVLFGGALACGMINTAMEASSKGNMTDAAGYLLVAVLVSPWVFLGALVMCTQYIVFRKERQITLQDVETTADTGEEGMALRITGKFVLDGRHERRFLCIPSALVRTEEGELLGLANADASTEFMGIRVARRAGIWQLQFRPWALHKLELGKQFYGPACLPAVRFDYIEGHDGVEPSRPLTQAEQIDNFESTESVVCAFDSEADRDRFLQMCAVPKPPSGVGGSATGARPR